MKNSSGEHGLFGLRMVVVAIFLYHGIPKALFWSMAQQKFAMMGFPGFLGPVVGIVEVIAGVLLLIGLYNRWSTLLLGAIILVAIIGVQVPGAVKAGKLLTSGLERDLLILASTVVLYFLGPGRPAITRSHAS